MPSFAARIRIAVALAITTVGANVAIASASATTASHARSKAHEVQLSSLSLAAWEMRYQAEQVGHVGHNRTRIKAEAATAATPQPVGISGDWAMVMDSEFDNGSALNTNVWTSGWFGTGVTDPVSTLEDDCYNSNNVIPTSTALDLDVTHQSSTCSGKTYPYTGSLISTQPNGSNTGFEYTYGVLEARVYIPAAANGSMISNWPGVWATTTPSTDSAGGYGEDDIVEGLAGQGCYHFHDSAEAPGYCDTTLTPGWHTFASDWQPGSITYYYDGVDVGSITSVPTTQPMYVALDNTVSADNLNIASADAMQVQYVRVWQQS
jgi:beta-glucanase (GH16 family)